MTERRVDVAVVTWNSGREVAETLRRLLDSEQGATLRLLVRDNGSSDDTVDAIRGVVPEALLDAGTENVGFAAGVNSILRRSDAPYVLLLNPDAWPTPGAIGRLIDVHVAHPRAAAVAPRMENPDGSLQHSTHPFPSVRVAALTHFRWHRIAPERAEALMLEGAWQHDRPRTVDWAHGSALLIKRPALEALGGLDERYFMYSEDIEWCWRAQRRGWEIRFEPSAVFHHVGNVSGKQAWKGRRTRVALASAVRFVRREQGWAAAFGWWGLTIAGTGVRGLRSLTKGDRVTARRAGRYGLAMAGAPFTRVRADRTSV